MTLHDEPTVSDGEREELVKVLDCTYPQPGMCVYCRTHRAGYEYESARMCFCCYGDEASPSECDGQPPKDGRKPHEIIADALLAAGYRKAPVVSVEDVAMEESRHIEWTFLHPGCRCQCGDVFPDGDAWIMHKATAVMALLEGGGRG